LKKKKKMEEIKPSWRILYVRETRLLYLFTANGFLCSVWRMMSANKLLLPTGGEFSASPSSPDTSDAAAVAAAAATTGPVVTLRTEHIVNGTLIKPPTLGGSRLATRHDLSPGGRGQK
jgi:hypothetical protein